MKQYNNILEQIMNDGVDRTGRNGKTRALFAVQMRFNLADGFPAVTTKKLMFKAVKSELLWFLESSSDDNRLKELNGTDKTIWTANANADYWIKKAKFEGDLGRIYGVQWRKWRTPDGDEIDQLAIVIDKIKNTPDDRRLLVSAWNPGELHKMALPPCHIMYQFFIAKGKISLHMVQRSCDMFLGVPFNIASYSLLLSMVAQVTSLVPHECVLTLNDAHIYHEHFDAVSEQLKRKPMLLPTLSLNKDVDDIDAFTMEDIELINYKHHPSIKARMIV